MNAKTAVLTALATLQMTLAHAAFETAFFRGNANHTGYFPAGIGSAGKNLKWKYTTGAEVVSSPVLSGGIVFIGSLDGYVYALSAGSGAEVWKVNTGAPVSGSAAVADGTVYIASENGHLYAIDAATGHVQWDQAMNTSQRPAGSPVVYGDVVYISQGSAGGYNTSFSSTQKAAGFSRTNGALVWQSSSTAAQGFESPIIYSNTLISSYGRDGYSAYSLASTNGPTVWTQTRDNSYGSQFACSALANDKLFVVGTMAGSLHAMNAATGARLWTAYADPQQKDIKNGGDAGNAVLTSPAVSGSRVFIGSNNGKFLCFDANSGSLLWSIDCGREIQSSPAVANGVVYFGCHDGKLRAVSETNGTEFWSYNAGARIISSPWVDDSAVYFGCDDGSVYCLQDGTAVADTDNDGLPDFWEQQYFGGPTNADPSVLAANGINTLRECYIAGLNPTNPSSSLLLSNIRPSISGNTFQWQGVSGRVYTVYWTSNLLASFQCLGSNLPWASNIFTDSAHNADMQSFYKISVQVE